MDNGWKKYKKRGAFKIEYQTQQNFKMFLSMRGMSQ